MITIMRREREGWKGGEAREEGRRWKKRKGKERETVNEHLCRVSCVMRLCGAVVKVTAFSQSLTLSPCSTVAQLCDPWCITKPLWASISSNVKWRTLPRVVWAVVRTHRSVPNQRQMLSLSAGDAECFRVLSSPNPAAQGQHNVCGSGCGSGYGADPQDLALLCAPAISSCQHLHLWRAFDRTTEASPASKQSGCTRMSVPPPPRR